MLRRISWDLTPIVAFIAFEVGHPEAEEIACPEVFRFPYKLITTRMFRSRFPPE